MSVRGEAVIEAEPELATLHIRVEAQAADQQTALALLTERQRTVSDLVKRFAPGIERSETTGMHVYPELRDKKNEKVRRYAGSADTTVLVHDFGIVSDLLVAASAVELTSVRGPYWQLRPTSPVFREARIAAAADALTRARDYAAAYGAEVLDLVQIADEGLSYERPPRPFHAAGQGQRVLLAAAVGEESIDLQPAKQQVTGRLEARFTLTQPDLRAVLPAPEHG